MEAQAVHQFFLQLMVILLAVVMLGPSLLGWMGSSEVIKLVAEIGIILLLLQVGLDTDIRQLAKSGWQALFVAVSDFLWSLVFGFSLSYWLFERSLLGALFIGGTLTATRIGITVRVVTDLKRQHSHEAQVVLGEAVSTIFSVWYCWPCFTIFRWLGKSIPPIPCRS
jgi:Kef-type K+ transport system membrane component KefB